LRDVPDQQESNDMAKIETIEGIGPKNRKALAKAGVSATQGLLKDGGTKKGRKAIAKESGCTEHQVLEWVNRADLMRVRGVGKEYSDLLEASGVNTVKELRNRKLANLHAKMHEVNSAKKKRLVRRPPSLSEVERWVVHAKELKPAVSH
jgi:predicted flap endonuclease-1-like 5' DNA nuclease